MLILDPFAKLCEGNGAVITYFDLRRRGSWGSTWHVWSGRNTCNRNRPLEPAIGKFYNIQVHISENNQKQVEIRFIIKNGEAYILEILLIHANSAVFCGLQVVIRCSMEGNKIIRRDS
jgi:hypothetical protein